MEKYYNNIQGKKVKKNIELTIILVYLLSHISSCSENKQQIEVIHIDKNIETGNLPLSSFAKSIEYIPLETNDNCLLASVTGLYVNDSMIIVSDKEKLLVFDLSGKFIRKMGNLGDGPEDYNAILSIAVDSQNELIYLLGINQITAYYFSGEFYGKSLYVKYSYNIACDYDGTFYGYVPDDLTSARRRYSIDVINLKRKRVVRGYKTNVLQRANKQGFQGLQAVLKNNNKEVLFKEMYNDTVFILNTANGLTPVAVMDDIAHKHNAEDHLKDAITKSAHFIRYNNIIKFNDLYFIRFGCKCIKGGVNTLIHNTKKHKTFLLKKQLIKDDLMNGPGFIPYYVNDENILIGILEPENIFELSKIEISYFPSINFDDNIIITIVK